MIKRIATALILGTIVASAWIGQVNSAEQFPLTPGINRIPVTIGGKTLRLVIDTGASNTAIDLRYRDLLGEEAGSEEILHQGLRTQLYTCKGLQVGSISTDLPRVACLSLGQILEEYGIDGVLGMDFLKSYSIEFDWAHERVILHDLPIAIRDTIAEIPMSFNELNNPFVVGTISNRRIRFMIDTGSSWYIHLSAGDEVWALRGELGKTVDVTGTKLSGHVSRKLTRLPQCKLGDCSWADILCLVQDSSTAPSSVGMALLETYHTIIDLPRQKLILLRANEHARPAEMDMSGMSFDRPKETAIVTSVEAGGPAENAEIEKGDILLEIDGIDCAKAKLGDLDQRLRSGDGNHVLLKVQHGSRIREIDLVLRRQI